MGCPGWNPGVGYAKNVPLPSKKAPLVVMVPSGLFSETHLVFAQLTPGAMHSGTRDRTQASRCKASTQPTVPEIRPRPSGCSFNCTSILKVFHCYPWGNES